MRTTVVLALLAVVLAIAFVSANDSADVAWSRTDNPFMRMAKKITGDSLIEEDVPKADDKGAANASDDDDSDDGDAQENDKSNKKSDTKAATPAKPAAAVEKAKTSVTSLASSATPAAGLVVPQVKESDAITQMLGKTPGANQDAQSAAATDAAGKILANAQAGNAPVSCGNVALCPKAGANATATNAANQKQNFTVLVPVQPKTNELDMAKLGATPKMSVSNKDFKLAKKVADVSGTRHEEFLNKHEKDCAGPICGGGK